MSKNLSSVYDEDGDTPDWVEIYNNSTDPINLGNYYLSDDANNLQKWQFPEGTLSPDSHIVVLPATKTELFGQKVIGCLLLILELSGTICQVAIKYQATGIRLDTMFQLGPAVIQLSGMEMMMT